MVGPATQGQRLAVRKPDMNRRTPPKTIVDPLQAKQTVTGLMCLSKCSGGLGAHLAVFTFEELPLFGCDYLSGKARDCCACGSADLDRVFHVFSIT